MASPRRVHKVAEKVRGLIALELQRVADPRFSLVTVTSAVVSRDLRHVKVYWMATGDAERRREVEEAFEGASGLFRRLLADGLGTRFVPDLRFYYDDTLDASDEIDRLLAKIRTGSPAQMEE